MDPSTDKTPVMSSMHECIKKLLANLDTPEEEDIESLCRLLLTVGYQIENTSKDGHGYMDIYFVRLKAIVDNNTVSSRLIFMIQVSPGYLRTVLPDGC